MFRSATNVCILYWQVPGPSENRAKQIAEFLGADCVFVPTNGARDTDSIRQLVQKGVAFIAHADVLARAAEDGIDVRGLIGSASQVFVYGFTPSACHSALVRTLSSGAFMGVQAPSEPSTFRVAGDSLDCPSAVSMPRRISRFDRTKRRTGQRY
jgi:hypothetical protein